MIAVAALLVVGGISVASYLIGFAFVILVWVFHHPFISLAFVGAGIGVKKLIAKS
jgi:hypothetical protein